MDDNRILTNKIFKQKINELVGADVIELEAANDDLALNCKIFEAGMDAIKGIISGGGSLVEHTLDVELDYDNIIPLVAFDGSDYPAWPYSDKQTTGIAFKGDQTTEDGIFHNKLITDVVLSNGNSIRNLMNEVVYFEIGYEIPIKPIVLTLNDETFTILFYTKETVSEIENLYDEITVCYIEYSQGDNSNA